MKKALKTALLEVWPDLPGPNLAAAQLDQALTHAGFAIVPVEPTEAVSDITKPEKSMFDQFRKVTFKVDRDKDLSGRRHLTFFVSGRDVINSGLWQAMLRAATEQKP